MGLSGMKRLWEFLMTVGMPYHMGGRGKHWRSNCPNCKIEHKEWDGIGYW